MEYDSLPADGRNGLEFVIPGLLTMGQKRSCEVWCDVIEPKGAEVLARYTEEYYAWWAAVSQNNYGQGETIYVGTIGDGAFYHALTRWLLEKASIEPLLATSRAVEVTAKEKDGRALLFLPNHASQDEEVELGKRYRDLLTDKAVEGEITIPPKEGHPDPGVREWMNLQRKKRG